jgi:hypothetical protein
VPLQWFYTPVVEADQEFWNIVSAALQAPDEIGHHRELKMKIVKNDEALAAALKSMPTVQASAL